jgi:uncharacterized protein involved in exopolysaccharide biosynthesis
VDDPAWQWPDAPEMPDWPDAPEMPGWPDLPGWIPILVIGAVGTLLAGLALWLLRPVLQIGAAVAGGESSA